jgi:hypothetical protein
VARLAVAATGPTLSTRLADRTEPALADAAALGERLAGSMPVSGLLVPLGGAVRRHAAFFDIAHANRTTFGEAARTAHAAR